ncbi:MAG TPA: glutamate racemase [Woeseiaceae bacterium]|nr:glutamate racemase [Woeseiaceae bacterium]
MIDDTRKPVGIFDSGVGGLTVLKALKARLPGEDFCYLGDTARLPYGTKSAASVLRYARQAAEHLRRRDIKLLVIACNTASAVALEDLAAEWAPLPVLGVVEPGASAAVAAAPAGRHLVLATEATVGLHAYGRAIAARDGAASVRELACELLVSLAEEGWTGGGIAEAIVRQYLGRFLERDGAGGWRPDSIILGCTHFPLLRDTIRIVAGEGVSIVDSAGTTAEAVAALLEARQWLNPSAAGRLELLATDGASRFARVGGAFLGAEVLPSDVQIVDL